MAGAAQISNKISTQKFRCHFPCIYAMRSLQLVFFFLLYTLETMRLFDCGHCVWCVWSLSAHTKHKHSTSSWKIKIKILNGNFFFLYYIAKTVQGCDRIVFLLSLFYSMSASECMNKKLNIYAEALVLQTIKYQRNTKKKASIYKLKLYIYVMLICVYRI